MNVRQQIVNAIAAKLGTIAPGVTFTLQGGTSRTCTTILARAPDGSPGVYSWRKAPFSKAQIPAINFRDEDAAIECKNFSNQDNRMKVTVEGLAPSDITASAARNLLADIVAAFCSDPRWGGLTGQGGWTNVTSQAIDLEQAGDVISACEASFVITYRTPYGII